MGAQVDVIDQLVGRMKIPRFVKVKQYFDRPVLGDPAAELSAGIERRQVLAPLKPGARVAVAVGSRGITNLPLLVKTLIQEIRNAGGDPFIVPAMGSHGGATAEGQRSMLVEMGMAEDYVGAPIRATMEVVQLGRTESGLPVYLDKYAAEAEGIVIINRVKPHVAFRGPYESGLMKMVAIGLGKQRGAEICHELGFGTMAANIPAIARVALAKAKFLFGVALLENAYHETCRVEVFRPEEIETEEPALQEEAKRLAPKLYLDRLDVLIIDEIGKDISGTGFDTNVVGRYHTPYITGAGPQIARIAVLDLTDRSHGNANGLGIVDFTTRRVFDKFRFEQTYPNSLTSTVLLSVKIPMVLRDDRQAIQAAIKTCNILHKEEVTMARIKNTLSLEQIEVSENLAGQVGADKRMEIASSPYELTFDENGNLF